MDTFELNCNSRQQIVDWLKTNHFPLQKPGTPGAVRIADYANAWHFSGKLVTEFMTVRIFRPGPYTVLNPQYAIAVIEQDGVVTFDVNNLTDTDAKYGTETRIAKN